MATHNSVRLVGYLLEDPAIANEGVKGGGKSIFKTPYDPEGCGRRGSAAVRRHLCVL